jgi:hypothetical protein
MDFTEVGEYDSIISFPRNPHPKCSPAPLALNSSKRQITDGE